MCQYGKAAIIAVGLVKDNGETPQGAWKKAIRECTDSDSSQDEKCPRYAFLGLCEEGMIVGIDSGEYGAGKKNKAYATKAVELLRRKPFLSVNEKELWKRVMRDLGEKTTKSYNSQMHVVTALWNNKLIAVKHK